MENNFEKICQLYNLCKFGKIDNITLINEILNKICLSNLLEEYKLEDLIEVLLLNKDFKFCYKVSILLVEFFNYEDIKTYNENSSIILILNSNLNNRYKIKMFNLFAIFYDYLNYL